MRHTRMPKRVIIDETHNHPAGGGSGATDATPTATVIEPSITSMTSVAKRRHTCWTLNNWTPEELERVRDYHTNTKSVRYGCWAQEVGETGTPHLQGYTAWTSPMSLDAFKKKLGDRLHYETNTVASAQQNHDYCAGLVNKKGNTLNPTFEEVGEMPHQGERTDWRKAVQQVRDRVPVVEVIYDQPHLVPNIRALERLETLALQPPKDRDVRVVYITGAAGVGKTRAITEAYPDAYWKPEGDWWDNYKGQQVVVLDDYYSDISYKTVLRVLDRYPLWLPIKGGFAPAEYTTVVITSNAELDEQYPNLLGKKRESLYRRIHRVINAQQGICGKDITDAVQDAPLHPQVRYPQAHKPSDDPSTDSPQPHG